MCYSLPPSTFPNSKEESFLLVWKGWVWLMVEAGALVCICLSWCVLLHITSWAWLPQENSKILHFRTHELSYLSWTGTEKGSVAEEADSERGFPVLSSHSKCCLRAGGNSLWLLLGEDKENGVFLLKWWVDHCDTAWWSFIIWVIHRNLIFRCHKSLLCVRCEHIRNTLHGSFALTPPPWSIL